MPNGVTFSPPQPPAPLTNVLTDTHIFVGDAANVPQDVALTLNATGGTFALANTGVLTMPNADAVTRGLLTAADWNTFNNKQNAIADWTTAFNSGTQATSSWSATNAAANVNAAIRPKGTGALIAAIPDGAVTGGNSRGQYAVDLQMRRANQERVATGNYSVISGGYSNRIHPQAGAYGIYCAIGGGNNNDCYGGNASTIAGGDSNRTTYDKCFIGGGTSNQVNVNHGVVSGGQSNTVSGDTAAIGGGQTNTASGAHSTVCGGLSNTASGQYAKIGGGANATAALFGQKAHASGQFAAGGDAQAHELVWRRLITGAPVGGTELFLNGSSLAAVLPSTNAIWQGIIDIAAICTATGNGTTLTGDVEATSYKVTIKRIGTTTSLVGTVQEIGTTNADTSMASGVFTIDNNDTNESLRIVYTSPVTAGSTTTIRVVATFRGLQIQY